VPVIALTQEMGSLGRTIGIEAARGLGYEFLRDDLIRGAARAYRVREARLVGSVEARPRLLERFSRRHRRHRTYLEAAVLEAAERERVVLGGRWSTVFLRGVRHAVRVRVCAPPPIRAERVMARDGIDRDEALRRIRAYDEGVRARMREMFDLEWADPVLYDLVINTETMTVASAVGQLVALAGTGEFQPTPASRGHLRDRALAARVRAALNAAPDTGHLEVDARAETGRVILAGVVAADSEVTAAVEAARAVPGVAQVTSELKVFRRPVR
jgi:cytidylate kinase